MGLMAKTSPEKNTLAPRGVEMAPGRVVQPVKLDLSAQLGGILEEVNRISEAASENPSEQLGANGTGGSMQQGGSQAGALSARQQAIANLPAPKVMQKQLEKHIRSEVKKLRKQAKTIARISHPGAAYHLNQIYASIRRLNALLAEMLEASYDVLKRLFVRVFIDRQPIL